MKLKITNIRDRGAPEKERVVLKVESSGNVGEYMLIQSGLVDGAVTIHVHNAYWFPDKEVNVGDFVVLYTKRGVPSSKPFKDVQSHFFYFGKDDPIWSHGNRAAVLLHAPQWESFRE